ncbi:MAG: M24 family metallopeptidase, partial [Bauldia litoralis]
MRTETLADNDGRSRTIVKLHDEAEFEGMRRAGRLAAATLDFITPHVKPGVTTGEIDQLCHDFMVEHGGHPATLGYKGYQHSSCTSVNHVVCHGIP